MSVLNCEDGPECPLCMEAFDVDDMTFYPCNCNYQICRFCWHRIRTDENGRCPACRKIYTENPANFKPLTAEDLQRIKQEKRQKDHQRKQKVTENRKHLSNVRVVQRNLVFVVGLTPRLADVEVLKKNEYFGKFGKIHKVVVNHTTAYAGSQGPSASAYVTYQKAEDALKAIIAVNNVAVDGRTLKASLGTTKYCSNFMKNQPCPKQDCMYLHELGDEAASFTKDEMQQMKHQEFEKKLQEQYLSSSGTGGKPYPLGSCVITPPPTIVGDNTCSGNNSNSCSGNDTSNQNVSNNSKKKKIDVINSMEINNSSQVREPWPALNSSPVPKETTKKSRKDRRHASEEGGKRNRKGRDKHNNNNNNTEKENSSVPCSQDSGNSSASTTPPLQSSTTPISYKASSPVPVNSVASSYDNNSPIGTTPSSLSSSEPSPTVLKSESVSLFGQPNDCVGEESTIIIPSEKPTAISTLSQIPNSLPNIDIRNFEEPAWKARLMEQLKKDGKKDNIYPEYNVQSETTINEFPANLSVIEERVEGMNDDELGFDPFHESRQALAEDIMKEKAEQQQKIQYQQKLQQQQNQRFQQQIISNKNLLELQQHKDISRLPPPGFNGMSVGNYNLPQHHQKLLPSFLSNINQSSNSPPPQINGYVPNKIGVPPGMPNNILNSSPVLNGPLNVPPPLNVPSSNNAILSGTTVNTLFNQSNNLLSGATHNFQNLQQSINSGLASHQMQQSQLGYDNYGGSGVGSVHNGTAKTGDAFFLKDLENSLRESNPLRVPSLSNTMINQATINQFLAQTQQAQNHYNTQQNIFHQLGTSATISNQPKGWNTNGATDLTAIDPAIVSQGQLTERSDSPPPAWFKTISNDWNTYPIDICSQLSSYSTVMAPNSQRNVWPPTSPPPGFNNLTLHKRETQKIENM